MSNNIISASFFMQTRVKGTIKDNHMHNRIAEVTVEFFPIQPDAQRQGGNTQRDRLCAITYNYDTGVFYASAGIKLTDEQLRMMMRAYNPAKIQSEGIDMAAEYLTEYAPHNPIDVTEHGLLVYAGDVTLE